MLVELEEAGNVGIVRLRRPERANALNSAGVRRLLRLQQSLRKGQRIRVVITVGEGKGFCAGSGLDELAGLPARKAVETQTLEARVCQNFLTLPQPTIAAVHGYALGGGLFLAAYHDFRIVSRNARMGCPEAKLGWNPTFGMHRLIQVAGLAPASYCVLSGEESRASNTPLQSFVTRLVAQDRDVLPAARELADKLPAASLAAIKGDLWKEFGPQLKAADRAEEHLFRRCLITAEARASLRRVRKPKGAVAQGD